MIKDINGTELTAKVIEEELADIRQKTSKILSKFNYKLWIPGLHIAVYIVVHARYLLTLRTTI